MYVYTYTYIYIHIIYTYYIYIWKHDKLFLTHRPVWVLVEFNRKFDVKDVKTTAAMPGIMHFWTRPWALNDSKKIKNTSKLKASSKLRWHRVAFLARYWTYLTIIFETDIWIEALMELSGCSGCSFFSWSDRALRLVASHQGRDKVTIRTPVAGLFPEPFATLAPDSQVFDAQIQNKMEQILLD